MSRSFEQYKLGTCLFEANPVKAPEFSAARGTDLPVRIDLRGLCSSVEDQGDIGSCAANAVVGAMEYHQRLHEQPVTDLSRLFVYYNARRLSDNESVDSGTFIHHAMAAIMAYGACPEAMWPYQKAMWATRPIDACYQAGLEFEAVSYARTPLGPACKAALCMGLPVVFGASLPSEMLQVEAALTGRVQVPVGGWPAPGGGHAMLIVGYDDAEGTWLIRNSWGADWGDGGYAAIPYEVMAQYGMPTQFWVIGAISTTAGAVLSGASLSESQASLKAAAADQASHALHEQRSNLRDKLETDLDRARAGFRDRLRGPGAGGGY